MKIDVVKQPKTRNKLNEMTLLRKFISTQLIFHRNVGKCNYNWYDEGIQYHGFKYYPRYSLIFYKLSF